MFASAADFVGGEGKGGRPLVVEATNSPLGFRDAVIAARIGGRVVLTGIPDGDVYTLPAADARRRALKIKFVRRMGEDFPRGVDLVASGQVNVRAVVSHRGAAQPGGRAVRGLGRQPARLSEGAAAAERIASRRRTRYSDQTTIVSKATRLRVFSKAYGRIGPGAAARLRLSRAAGPVYTRAMNLSSEEVERYARQIVLHGVGGPGQNRLKAARVLVVGAGGLGSPALQYLAAAGVGTLGIVDDDVVALSNLHRQILHGTRDIGRPKTVARRTPSPASTRMSRSSRSTCGSNPPNAREIVGRFDVALDGSDNFATRYALSDACFFERRPLVTGALGEFDGTLTLLKPYETGPDGRPNPT